MVHSEKLWSTAVFLLAVSVVPAACTPLRDFSDLSDHFGASGGVGGEGGDGAGANGGAGGDSGSATCGDGIREKDEACDTGKASATCDADCTKPVCGDLVTNALAGEKCDSGGATDDCFECEAPDPPCVDGCSCVTREGHRYAFCDGPAIYDVAKAACAGAGFEMLAVESQAEDDFVAGRGFAAGWTEYWLGASDAANEGTWKWVTGSTFYSGGASGSPVGGSYENWSTGEPNDTSEANNCAIVAAANNAWLDVACPEVRSFVCELNGNPTGNDCGDGKVDAGEACDEGGESELCDSDCTRAVCGDGITNLTSGEDCDDGNSDELDACRADCKTSGLVVYYPMTERRGSIVYDRGLANANLALKGAANILDEAETGVLFSSPAYGEATSTSLDFSGDFSIAVGVRTSAVGGYHYIARDNAVPGSSEFHMRLTGTELEVFTVDDQLVRHPAEATPLRIADSNFNGAAFLHFAYTCKGGKWSAYRDGVLIGTATDTACRPPGGAATWTLGATAGGASDHLGGRLQEFRLYERALSATEVLQLKGRLLP